MYKLTTSNIIINTVTGDSIPMDLANAFYQQYLKWRDGWTEEIIDIESGVLTDTVIHQPNTPSPSLSKDEYIGLMRSKISATFLEAANDGFQCSSGIKYDSKLSDIQALKSAHELATALAKETVEIRDFNNQVHTLALAVLWSDIIQLGVNFSTQLGLKWYKKDMEKGDGYAQFVPDELAKHLQGF